MASQSGLRRAWDEGRTALGLWSVVPGSFGVEILARTGVDYVCVDGQHGLIGFDAMVPMLQAIGAGGSAPITRVPSNDPYGIMKSLDAGARGVIVPLVNSAADAERAVAACRYPPRGMRSYGPIRAGGVMGTSDPETLEKEALCLVMVETREALERVEEIAATPGLDGIYVGPSDLALSLGLPATIEVLEDEHAEAVERVRRACAANGVVAGIHASSGEWARRHADAGFEMVTVATDASLLMNAALAELAVVRGEGAAGAPTP